MTTQSNLLGIRELSQGSILELLDRAQRCRAHRLGADGVGPLSGKTIAYCLWNPRRAFHLRWRRSRWASYHGLSAQCVVGDER